MASQISQDDSMLESKIESNIDSISLVSQPENLRRTLFPHQISLIYKMEKLEVEKVVELGGIKKETIIGINSEMTGYGKTMSMIGLIVRISKQMMT